MLEKWEMNHKRLKKSVYAALFERDSISRSFCVRALSEREVDDYRNFGIVKPIAIVPNGINPIEPVDTAEFFVRFPELKGKAIILFLGRVFHKKGVLNLLQAWKKVAARRSDAHLVIAGPEYADTGDRARDLVASLDLSENLSMVGVLSGRMKLAALSASMYFCLPSFSEGFSMAVLEALSIGTPPIITPECNFPTVGSSQAGIITSNEPDALAETLISCLNLRSSERATMSDIARRLARSEFAWETTGKAMHSVHEWMLGGDRPPFVTT
jgi:glycosyltransferase involved in cell wall biosynthesis